MPRISDDDIRRVREASDLVAIASERVVLKQKGRLFWGCCPFHNEKTPSFKIDPSTQLWHCFGCSQGGDVFKFVQLMENVDFPDAVRMLADRAHIEIVEVGGSGVPRSRKDRMKEACTEAARFYHMQLMRSRDAGASSARSYLSERGFGSAPSKAWELGYAPGRGQLVAHLRSKGFARDELLEADLARVSGSGRLMDRFYERIMFPIHDLQGKTIAFGGRVVGSGEPKYLNTGGTPVFNKSENLFGVDRAKSSIVAAQQAIVVEGYTDVIALHEAGIGNAVATLGTALTSQHVKMLSRFASTIVYLFDGDAAGQKAADRAVEFIDWSSAVESSRNPVELKVTVLPGGMDPAEFVAAQGADALRERMSAAEPLLRFSINRRLDAYDLRKPESKARAMQDALAVLAPLKDSVTATDYVNLIADRLNVAYTSVFEALKETRAPVAARHRQQQEAVSEPQTRPISTAAEKVIEQDQRAVRMERGLISLVVSDATLLDDIDRDLARISWTDSAAEAMADVLMTCDHRASPAQVLVSVQEACEQAPALLSQVMVEADSRDDKLYEARLLLRSLRERDLEREIRAAKSSLRSDAGLSAEQLDELFEKTVRLQKELGELRNRGFADIHDRKRG